MSKIKLGYKMTGISEIPEEWEVVRLGDEDKKVAEIIMGQSPPSSTYNDDGSGLPFLQGKAEFGEIYPTPKMYTSKPMKIAEPGDILVSVRAPVGDVNLAPFRCCVGRGLAAIRPKDNLDSLFLFYHLKTTKEKLESKGGGTTFREINKGILEDFAIPFPPLTEQRKIAKVLSTIQQAIEQQDRIIEATRKLKKSLMQKLFRFGISDLGVADLKETEIGLIPRSWEVVRLEEMFDMQQGKAMSPKSRLGISPHPFLRTINILWGNVDLSILDHMDFTDEEMTKLCLQPDDLLVCEGGEIGRTAMWRREIEVCGYQNHIHRLRKQRQDICPEFYMYWMQAAFLIFGLYAGEEIRTTIPNLSRGRLKSFLIPKPPLPEQKEIARILNTVDKKIEVEEKRKATLKELFKTMLHKLMTGEIRLKDVEV